MSQPTVAPPPKLSAELLANLRRAHEEGQSPRELWVMALRSGEFGRGQSYLRNSQNDSFCCLGVACEVYRLTHLDDENIPVWVNPHSTLGVGFQLIDKEGNGVGWAEAYALPPYMRKWLGVSSSNPAINANYASGLEEWPTAASVNDTTEATFAEIADMIERGLR